MKLNLGCGFNKRAGYINVDKFSSCEPDLVLDLEVVPWSFGSSEVDEIILHHSLEHLGATTSLFLEIMKELYRVCKPGAKIDIKVPHPKHDNFIGDPTHVRIITPQTLALFSKKLNYLWRKNGSSNSPLAIYLDVDFEIKSVSCTIEPKYMQLLNDKKISEKDLDEMVRERNNIATEYQIVLEVIK